MLRHLRANAPFIVLCLALIAGGCALALCLHTLSTGL